MWKFTNKYAPNKHTEKSVNFPVTVGTGQCVGGLSVDNASEKTIWVPCNCCVEKRNGVIFLDFHGKTNSRLLTV